MARRRWNREIIQQVVDGENPFIQVGYTGPSKRRKVGDEWTDGKNIKWKKTENGVVRVNDQADSIREMVRPRCSVCHMDINLFGDRIDKKLHSKTGKCFECLETEEQLLKLTGQYQKYEDLKIAKNKLSYLRDFRAKVMESIDYLKKDDSKLSVVTSQGDVVTWTGSQNEELLKEAEKDLTSVEKLIAEVEVMVDNMPKPEIPA